MGLLIYNVKNSVGLGVRMEGTAAEAWKSLTDQYHVMSKLALVNAQCELHMTILNEGGDLLAHISDLRTKWTKANTAGAKIKDTGFQMILLSSLPTSWDSLIAMLYDARSSADIITQSTMHWSRLTCSGISTNPTTTTVALQANTQKNWQKPRSPLLCTNKNCGHHGHLIENCYWPGSRKEEQFPPGFGKRGGDTGISSNAPGIPTANVATVSKNITPIDHVYTLMASNSSDVAQSKLTISVDVIQNSPTTTALISGKNGVEMRTYTDPSNNCFMNKSDFEDYELFNEPCEGQGADRTSKFKIYGCGKSPKYSRRMRNVPNSCSIQPFIHLIYLQTSY